MAWIHVIEINVDDFTGSAVYETHHFLIITKAHPVFYLFIIFKAFTLLSGVGWRSNYTKVSCVR